jgi:hypothetical protein
MNLRQTEFVIKLPEEFFASKVFVNGMSFKSLYPELFNASDLEVSKLQMMQTKPQNYTLDGSILRAYLLDDMKHFTSARL